MSLKVSRVERKIILDQTRHFEANRAVRIFIRAHFSRMLTKVNCWLVLKAKLLNMVQTHIESLGTRAKYSNSLIWPFRS